MHVCLFVCMCVCILKCMDLSVYRYTYAHIYLRPYIVKNTTNIDTLSRTLLQSVSEEKICAYGGSCS